MKNRFFTRRFVPCTKSPAFGKVWFINMKNKKKSSEIPTSLSSILNSDPDALDYFNNMDKASRNELVHYANDFGSSEELQRYIYYSIKDSFK